MKDFEPIRVNLTRLTTLANFCESYAFDCSEGKSSEYAFAKAVCHEIFNCIRNISNQLDYVENRSNQSE